MPSVYRRKTINADDPAALADALRRQIESGDPAAIQAGILVVNYTRLLDEGENPAVIEAFLRGDAQPPPAGWLDSGAARDFRQAARAGIDFDAMAKFAGAAERLERLEESRLARLERQRLMVHANEVAAAFRAAMAAMGYVLSPAAAQRIRDLGGEAAGDEAAAIFRSAREAAIARWQAAVMPQPEESESESTPPEV